jgi:hypothetical protein
VVTSHALSFTNDHFEIERDALANAPDLDHGDLSVVEPPETGGTVEVVEVLDTIRPPKGRWTLPRFTNLPVAPKDIPKP